MIKLQFNKKKFGQRLKEARNKKNLSQDELSNLTGISIQTLSSYETGHSAPVMDYMYLISLALNISVDYLLFGEEHNSFKTRSANMSYYILITVLFCPFFAVYQIHKVWAGTAP